MAIIEKFDEARIEISDETAIKHKLMLSFGNPIDI